MNAPKLVILGRDGILNEFREDHVKSASEWQSIPGALDAVARLNHAGWHAVVATNQSGIGRGMIDMATLNEVHAHLVRLLAAAGGRLDGIFFCPHVPEDHCSCRKPLPGLMQQIGLRYGVDLAQVPMVCDTSRDLQAAHAAGCQPHLVLSARAAGLEGMALEQWLEGVPQVKVHADLSAFADAMLRHERRAEQLDSGPMGMN